MDNFLRFSTFLSLSFILALSSCKSIFTGNATQDTHRVLIFEEDPLYLPTGNYFKIDVDITNKIYSPISIISDVPCLKSGIAKEIEHLVPNGTLSKILDVSSDGKWVAASYKVMVADGQHGPYPKVFLLTNNGLGYHLIKELPGGIGYFTKEANKCFYSENWKLFEMDLKTFETNNISETPTSFLNPKNGNLVTFDPKTGRIIEIDIKNNYSSKDIGRFKHHARDSGLIDEEWAYYITGPRGKAPFPSNLFFLNLKTYKIYKYPRDFRESHLVCVEKKNEN